MFIKPIKIPKLILEMEALARRLLPIHPEKQSVIVQAGNVRAGYNGEASLEYLLNFLPYHQFLIFHYLRIPDSKGFFQMDLLLLSLNFLLIIEVKNIKDVVTFDEMGQSVRTTGGKEEVFTNPIEQVNLQHLRLLNWMRKCDIPLIPIEKVVVYSNSKTILKNMTNDKAITEVTIRKERLLSKIEEIPSKYKTSHLSEKQLIDISCQLLDAHVPEKANAMNKYGISSDELMKGVICPKCDTIPMKWNHGKWICRSCGFKLATAHRGTLADYGLLVGQFINNRQAQEILMMDSEYAVRRLFKKEGFDKYGTTSGHKYIIDPEKIILT